MRRIVVAFVVAVLAFALVGCGGGEEAATETAPEADAAAAPAAAPEPMEPAYVTDRSLNVDETTPTPFPSFTTTITPYAFQEKLDARRPMLILFYDKGQTVTKDLRAEVDAVIEEYRGLIDLVTFDVSGGGDPKAAEDAIVYATELGVQGTPHVLIVDRGSFITWQWKGYVERGVLEREVERVTR